MKDHYRTRRIHKTKKCLKIPKGPSEAVIPEERQTTQWAKGKGKNNDLQKHYTEN